MKFQGWKHLHFIHINFVPDLHVERQSEKIKINKHWETEAKWEQKSLIHTFYQF